MTRTGAAVLLLAGLACALPHAALGEGASATLDKLELGTHVFGDRLTAEDLAGRVVVAYFWDAG